VVADRGSQNVRQSLDDGARGAVDAAFVYRSDVGNLPERVRVAFEVPLREAIRYPIAALAESDSADEAARFVDYVMSADGQAVLGRHGFLRP
jgi:molybdate transport system substrate-binding protein